MKHVCALQGPDKTYPSAKANAPLVRTERLPQSRSMNTIEFTLHPKIDRMGEIIINCTLFKDPFATTDKLSDWISDTCKEAFEGSDCKPEECHLVCQ